MLDFNAMEKKLEELQGFSYIALSDAELIVLQDILNGLEVPEQNYCLRMHLQFIASIMSDTLEKSKHRREEINE